MPMTLEEWIAAAPDLSEIAVHADHDNPTLAVYAWCVTCNSKRPGGARFSRNSHGLAELIEGLRLHIAGELHRTAPAACLHAGCHPGRCDRLAEDLARQPHPCDNGCSDPAVHAEGGHDI